MTSVTSALIKVFESSGFECELVETEKEDQVRIPITGDTFGPRLMVVRFPHEGDYMAVFLPDLLEIPKGKASTALKVANELHRSSHLVKFWVEWDRRGKDRRYHGAWLWQRQGRVHAQVYEPGLEGGGHGLLRLRFPCPRGQPS